MMKLSVGLAAAAKVAAKREVGVAEGKSQLSARENRKVKRELCLVAMDHMVAERRMRPKCPALPGASLHPGALLSRPAAVEPGVAAIALLVASTEASARAAAHKKMSPHTDIPADFGTAHAYCARDKTDGGLGMGAFINAGQVVKVFRMQRNVNDPKCTVAQAENDLAGALADERRIKLKDDKNIDLTKHMYAPQPVGGHLRAFFEDPLHKLGNMRTSILHQKDHEEFSTEANGLAISRQALLATCAARGEDLKLERDCIVHADAMDKGVCECFMSSQLLFTALEERGHYKEAHVLRAIIGGFDAFDVPGYTAEKRTEMLQQQTDMIDSLFGNRQFDPCHATQGNVAGIPSTILTALRYKADARDALRALHPEYELCEKMLGSNACENVFSLLIGSVGYKAFAEIMERHLKSVYRKEDMARNPNIGFSIPVSTGQRYPVNRDKRLRDWDDGSKVGPSDEAQAARDKAIQKRRTEGARKTRTRGDLPRQVAKSKGRAGPTR